MGLSKKQQENAERLKAALEQDDQEAVQTAGEMGKAVKAGDVEKLAKLTDKAKKRGWVK